MIPGTEKAGCAAMRIAVLALGVFAGGVVAGALLHGGMGRGETAEAAARRVGDRASGDAGRSARTGWGVEDFLARIHEVGERPVTDDADLAPEGKALAEWSNGELARALDEAVTSPDAMLEKSATGAAVRALLRAWMLKDRAACLEWLQGMKSESMRIDLAADLEWPAGSEEESLSFSLAHPEIYPHASRNRGRWIKGLEAAARRGPEAVETHLAALHGAGQLTQAIWGINYPPGFDFATLAQGPEGRRLWQLGRTEVMLGWLKQDREAAFQAVVDYTHEKSWFTLERGLVVQNGKQPDPELAGWLAGKLSEFDEKQRAPVIQAEAEALRADPAALASFAAGLSAEDRRGVDEYAVRAIHLIGPEAALAHLEMLGTPAERIAFLEKATVIHRMGDWQRDEKFGEEQQPAFRKTLESWGATPEQAGRIMKRLEVPQ